MENSIENLNPYYFRLLVAIISLEEKGDFEIPLSVEETKFFARNRGIGPEYGPKILGGGYKGWKNTRKSLKIDTLNKLVYYLTSKYGYKDWEDFKEKESNKEMNDLQWQTYYELRPNNQKKVDEAIRIAINIKIGKENIVSSSKIVTVKEKVNIEETPSKTQTIEFKIIQKPKKKPFFDLKMVIIIITSILGIFFLINFLYGA